MTSFRFSLKGFGHLEPFTTLLIFGPSKRNLGPKSFFLHATDLKGAASVIRCVTQWRCSFRDRSSKHALAPHAHAPYREFNAGCCPLPMLQPRVEPRLLALNSCLPAPTLSSWTGCKRPPRPRLHSAPLTPLPWRLLPPYSRLQSSSYCGNSPVRARGDNMFEDMSELTERFIDPLEKLPLFLALTVHHAP